MQPATCGEHEGPQAVAGRRAKPWEEDRTVRHAPQRCQEAALACLAAGTEHGRRMRRTKPCSSLPLSPTWGRFVEGQIEALDQAGIADESVDLVISNCVVGAGHLLSLPVWQPLRLAWLLCQARGRNLRSIGELPVELFWQGLPQRPRDGNPGPSFLPCLQVNLSPDKGRVLSEVHRVLAPGGEMFFSDVYCDRRLPQEVRGGAGALLLAQRTQPRC